MLSEFCHRDSPKYEEVFWRRLWRRVQITPSCWLWLGSRSTAGYGTINFGGRYYNVHRLVYEKERGRIPRKLTLDHLCRVRHCVRPAHMEVVTMTVNVMRGVGPTAVNARKTHCKRGHALAGTNLYVIMATGYRQCRACRVLRDQERATA